jgi:hypothetical protein
MHGITGTTERTRNATALPVAYVAELIGVSDSRVWRVLHRHVGEAMAREDFANVRRVGIDKTPAAEPGPRATFARFADTPHGIINLGDVSRCGLLTCMHTQIMQIKRGYLHVA